MTRTLTELLLLRLVSIILLRLRAACGEWAGLLAKCLWLLPSRTRRGVYLTVIMRLRLLLLLRLVVPVLTDRLVARFGGNLVLGMRLNRGFLVFDVDVVMVVGTVSVMITDRIWTGTVWALG